MESLLILIGIWKREWAVRPPYNSNAAIPDDATARAIPLLALTEDSNVLYKNVFPVPPNPSTKKQFSIW